MPKESHFQITKLSMPEREYFSEPINTQQIPKMTSNLKKWKIYDKQTSITFFYSEIEKCWLVTINSGSCKINKNTVCFKSENLLENSFIVDKSIEIEINSHSFLFENTPSNTKQHTGVSNILVNALLKTKNFTLSMETVLKIISQNCEYYKDFYFVLDAIRKNRIFDYKYGEVRLNILELYNYIKNDRSPILESILYESENGLMKNELKPFSIMKMWDSSDFIQTSEQINRQAGDWPTPSQLQSIMTDVSQRTSCDYESYSPKDALPSPKSTTSRYINSYSVDKSVSSNKEKKKTGMYSNFCSSEADSDEMKDSSISEESSKTSEMSDKESETLDCEIKRMEYAKTKRHRHYFDFDLNPALEKFVISADSEFSAPYSDFDTKKKNCKEKKNVLRSASCIEDGFLFDKCTDFSQIPSSSIEGYFRSLKQQKCDQHKNRQNNFKIAPLKRYDVYKIKRFG